MLPVERWTWHLKVIFHPNAIVVVPTRNRIEVQWVKLVELLKLMGFFWLKITISIAMDILNCFLSLSTEAFRISITTRFNFLRRNVLVDAVASLGPACNLKVLLQVLCRRHWSRLHVVWSIIMPHNLISNIVPEVITFGVYGWFKHTLFGLLLDVVFHHLISGIHEIHVNNAWFCKIWKSFIRGNASI